LYLRLLQQWEQNFDNNTLAYGKIKSSREIDLLGLRTGEMFDVVGKNDFNGVGNAELIAVVSVNGGVSHSSGEDAA